jgi:hypothetical protein
MFTCRSNSDDIGESFAGQNNYHVPDTLQCLINPQPSQATGSMAYASPSPPGTTAPSRHKSKHFSAHDALSWTYYGFVAAAKLMALPNSRRENEMQIRCVHVAIGE